MNTPIPKHILNVPLEHGEISVVLADNAEEMLCHSAKFATDCSNLGVGVMLVNCGLSERRFNEHTEHIKKYPDVDYLPKKQKPRLIAYNSTEGDLIGDSGTIEAMFIQAKVSVVIIMGWEWTSSRYARKERLLYFMRKLAKQGNAVVVYSQARTNPTAGRPDRGGIGKLAMLAYGIVNVQGAIEAAKIAPSPTPIVATSEEMEKVEKNIQLVMNKINELPEKSEGNSDQLEINRRGAESAEGEEEKINRPDAEVAEEDLKLSIINYPLSTPLSPTIH